MEKITVSADTLENAITEASLKLGITSENLSYEIVEKGTKGFLGIGAKEAVIEAWQKTAEEIEKEKKAAEDTDKKDAEEKKQEAAPEEKQSEKANAVKASSEKAEAVSEKKETTENDDAHIEAGRKFLEDVFRHMEMQVQIEAKKSDDETVEINLSGDEMGVLIGKRGQTLDSLQYLTSLVVNASGEHYLRVKLDTENYRERRKETLESLAKNIAYKVKRTRKSVSLEPMNPYERRIIHAYLQPDNFVMTKSEGEEPYRHVVVFYKRNRNGEER